MSRPLRPLFACIYAYLTLSVLTISTFGADFYLTPSGSGNQDGSSWEDAFPQEDLDALIDSTQPGDRILLASGTYTIPSLSVNSSGTEGNPKAVIGLDTGEGLPLFEGDFDVNNSASSSFMVFPGEAHHWEFKNLRFRNQPFVINMRRSGTTDTLRTNIVFENLHFYNIEDAIRLYNASDILVQDCTAIRYTKKAFRIGDYTSFVTFQSCFADCNEGDPTFPSRSIPNGFALDDTDFLPIIHDISFIDCIAQNNGYSQPSSDYWNGDGFASERGAYNILYLRCKSFNNNDAGFDNKASYITYQDCIAVGNSRGFRHWADNGNMFNSVSTFNFKHGGSGSPYAMWISGNGGELNIDFSTVHGDGPGVVAENGSTVTVSNSILSTTSGSAGFASASVTLIDSETYRPGEGTDPDFVSPTPEWRGTPLDAMDSQTFGLTKGYHSGRVDTEPNSPPTLSISASTTYGIAPVTIDFDSVAEDSDGYIVSYLWDFGDGQFSSDAAPSHSYDFPGEYTIECRVTDNRGASATASIEIVVDVPTTPQAVRIESGSTEPYVDLEGNTWSSDFGYGPGGGIADRGAIEIANTDDDKLYQTERWGVTGYDILLANGTYNVTLHFAETYSGITAAGQRVFTVSAEDTFPASWQDIDVFAESGGSNTALAKTAYLEISDNLLTLDFIASVDNPMISAIEIVPASSGDLPPTPPAIFSSSNIQTDSFVVGWLGAMDDTGIQSYDVYLDGILVETTSGNSYTATGLDPYSPYNITVRARDLAGNVSQASEIYTVKTLDDGTVGKDIIIDNSDSRSVTIEGDWTTSSASTGFYGANYLHNGDTGQGTKSVTYTPDFPRADTYEIYARWASNQNRANNVPYEIVHASGTTTVTANQRVDGDSWNSLGVYDFAAGTGNSVTIRTDNANGYVIADSIRFVATDSVIDTEAPSIPEGLSSSNISTTSFSASWSPSTDDTGVVGYEVYLGGDLYAEVTETSVTIDGLTENTVYSITVAAKDAAGNVSDTSEPLLVTTQSEDNGGGEGGGASGILSFNLTGPGSELDPTAVAGVVPAAYWNNTISNNQVLNNVFNSDGETTGVTATFANTTYYYENGTPEMAEPLADDALMMRTQRARSNANRMAAAVEGLEYETYDVYVYWGGSKTNETVPLTMAVNLQLWDGSGWVISDTKYLRDDDFKWDGTYDESTAVTPEQATDGAEYVVFRDMTTTSFRILAESGNRNSFAGFQVVSQGSDDPGDNEGTAPQISSATESEGVFNESYDYQIVASNEPTEYAAIGLPAGLSLDSSTGSISGIPEESGTFSIQLSATNPSGVGEADLTLSINPASQTISFPEIASLTYGDGSVTLNATATSGLPVSYQILSGPASIDGDMLAIEGAGEIVVEGSQSGNSNYLPAPPVSQVVSVTKATAEIQIDQLWQLYDGLPKPVSVTTIPEGLEYHLVYDETTLAPIYPGSYNVSIEIEDANYIGNAIDSLKIVTTALVELPPSINGFVDGSVQFAIGGNTVLNGGSAIFGDLLVPGSPQIRLNGQPTFIDIIEGPSTASTEDYRLTLNGSSTVGYIVTKTDAPAIPVVDAPVAPTGELDIYLDQPEVPAIDYAQVRNITVQGAATTVELPSGNYGNLTLNSDSIVVLGSADSEVPTEYGFQQITLNASNAKIAIAGPVIITVATDLTLNGGTFGTIESAGSTVVRIADGDLRLNGGTTFYGFVEAPSGEITVNGDSTLAGCIISQELTINGNGSLIWPIK